MLLDHYCMVLEVATFLEIPLEWGTESEWSRESEACFKVLSN